MIKISKRLSNVFKQPKEFKPLLRVVIIRCEFFCRVSPLMDHTEYIPKG
jgi:hypothetical protein